MLRLPLCIAILIAFSILNTSAHAAQPVNNFNDVVRKTEPLSPEEELKSFHLPPGFEAQLVASEPDIHKPINMNFDAAGRLWITNTIEYPHPAKDPEKARDSIKILSDFDAHGKARKIVTFAGGLNIPVGVLPYGSGAIGHSIPFIHYFEDTTGGGKSDKRRVLLDRIGFQKDTHGMSGNFVRGFDGWIYATHGFNNDSVVKALDGSEIKMNSGNTYRFRPDGSHIEQFAWGQVNPFGLALDPLGNLYSADCETKPMYQLLRGAHYPSFGKKDDGLGFAPEMMAYMHNSTAVGGIVIYSDDRFPEEFRDNGFTGNVMTCKINRDLLVDTGTTRTAQIKPDFLTADDPWFRPVCLQLGPDGALYVADFYNRIIGHYEVSLTHPGRDRERGRIWRIVYKGTPEKQIADALPPDLTKMNAEELIALTASNNLTLRMLALWQLVERTGAQAATPLKETLKSGTPRQKICALWALYNLQTLDAGALANAAHDADASVRVHAMKVLAEFNEMDESRVKLALAGLDDANSWVKRNAAEALGLHPALENLRPLIALRKSADGADTHLVHVVRMALRNQLLQKGMYEKIAALKPAFAEKEWEALADVALGAPCEDAAAVVVRYLSLAQNPRNAEKFMEHAVKYLPFEQLDAFVAQVRVRFAGSDTQQLAMLKSIQDGAARRGIALSPAVRAWALEVLGKVLAPAEEAPAAQNWIALTLDGKPNPANPWVPQNRKSSDNFEAPFLCSLPLGEQLTGAMRSPPFDMPARMAFFLAGHNGLPPQNLPIKNFIRLLDAQSGEELVKTAPPRNDLAQPFHWDLAKFAGRKGVIELVDGDGGGAYAWMAAGRFEPNVIELPGGDAALKASNIQVAVALAGPLKLKELSGELRAIWKSKKQPEAVRGAAAVALVTLDPSSPPGDFAAVLNDANETPALRERAADALAALESKAALPALLEAMKGVPDKLQTKIAQALSANAASAQELLAAVAAGKASARVLFDKTVKDRLSQLKLPEIENKIAALTKGLQPADKELQNLIDARVKAFGAAKASAEAGVKIFEKNCMACHQLDGKGTVIGPQLDGVGARGLERIAEDVLDPSRNVDIAFRVSLVKLINGSVFSGLKRREEGEQIIFADSKGVESSLAKKDIREIRETPMSLMPDGFGEAMTPVDFNHLMAFLLSKTVKR